MNTIEFSERIGLPRPYIERISKRSKYLYKSFQILKKNGSDRLIESPNQELKGIQSWILQNILNKYVLPDCVHGFRKKHSIKTNAIPHLGKKYLICLDIKDFFPSIHTLRVNSIFKETCDSELSKILTGICVYNSHLPQGSVCSPCLANLAFRKIDNEIEKLCSEDRIAYTRYADDLTFSSNDKDRLISKIEIIIGIITRFGFEVNSKKTRYMNGKGPMIVTGLRLNSKKLSIGSNKKRELRSRIFNYYNKGIQDNENEILGMLSYLRGIEPKKYAAMKKYVSRINTKRMITE